MADPAKPRDCERQCRTCKRFKHFSRFRHWRDSRSREGTSSGPRIDFSPDCLDCEQKLRNERKNEDRALTIIKRRAAAHAKKAGVPASFFWLNMNYRALVPVFRAMMSPEGLCTSCGHPFDNERDAQIEHRVPPRHRQDWARLHARNCEIMCTNENRRKHGDDYSAWLDEMEECRLSNEAAGRLSFDQADVEQAEVEVEGGATVVLLDPEPGRCTSVKYKTHDTTRTNPFRTHKPSTWRCALPDGHPGPHQARPSAHQAPWEDQD